MLGLTAMVLALTLAACDSGPEGTPVPTTPPAVPTPVASPTPAPQVGTSIHMEKTGGIAGVHEVLDITTQGGAKYTSGDVSKKQLLPAATFDGILQQIDKADFFNLKDNYDSGTVADDFYYTLTIRKDDVSKTVKMAQVGGKDLAPQALQDLISKLTEIQGSLQGK
jgi:hypothetical protein